MNVTFDSLIKSRTLDIDLRTVANPSESLGSLCTDLFLIIMNISPKIDMGTEDELRGILRYYVDRFDQNCATARIDTKKQSYAKYALVALIDEKVLKLPSKWSGPWKAHMLQLDYFDDMVAGERFFENLSLLQKEPGNYHDVLEIYYLCLSLGFKGMYQARPEELKTITASLPKVILSSRLKTNAPKVNYTRQEIKPRGHIPMVSSWLIAAVAAIIIIGGWFGMRQSLNSSMQEQLEGGGGREKGEERRVKSEG